MASHNQSLIQSVFMLQSLPVTLPLLQYHLLYNPSPSSHNVNRLPKLNTPVYTGDPLLWQSFLDCFDVAINLNLMLTGVQKFSYLRVQLQGDATRVIAGFPLPTATTVIQ